MRPRAIAMSLLLALGSAGIVAHASDVPPPLDVVGTIVGEGKPPIALVHDRSANRQRVCRIGDEVNGAIILAIAPDRVVIGLDGNRIELRLAVSSPAADGRPAAATGGAPAGAALEGGPPQGVSRQELLRLSRAPEMLLQVAETDRGARVVTVLPDGLLDLLGIRQGDVILDVNGRVPAPGRSFVQVFREAVSADRTLRVHYERQSVPDSIYLTVRP